MPLILYPEGADGSAGPGKSDCMCVQILSKFHPLGQEPNPAECSVMMCFSRKIISPVNPLGVRGFGYSPFPRSELNSFGARLYLGFCPFCGHGPLFSLIPTYLHHRVLQPP